MSLGGKFLEILFKCCNGTKGRARNKRNGNVKRKEGGREEGRK